MFILFMELHGNPCVCRDVKPKTQKFYAEFRSASGYAHCFFFCIKIFVVQILSYNFLLSQDVVFLLRKCSLLELFSASPDSSSASIGFLGFLTLRGKLSHQCVAVREALSFKASQLGIYCVGLVFCRFRAYMGGCFQGFGLSWCVSCFSWFLVSVISSGRVMAGGGTRKKFKECQNKLLDKKFCLK